jgi:hypothetical protein
MSTSCTRRLFGGIAPASPLARPRRASRCFAVDCWLEFHATSEHCCERGGQLLGGRPQRATTVSTGKKLVGDAYGPRVPIGGALSGKDFYKVDRVGALIARRLAKLIFLTGAARECSATVAFQPGVREASVVSLVNENGESLDSQRWGPLFDLSLAGVGDRYSGRTELADVARHGHFTDPALPWERFGEPGGDPSASHYSTGDRHASNAGNSSCQLRHRLPRPTF